MFLILGVIVVTIIAHICAFHYEFMRMFGLSLKFEGPPALPVIGNGLLFLKNTSSGDLSIGPFETIQRKLFDADNEHIFLFIFVKLENFDLINQLVRQYGVIFRVWLGPVLNFVVSDFKDVEVWKIF